MPSDKTKRYLSIVGPLLRQARSVAQQYKEATGRPLGITGEVAEYEAVRLLDLDICEVRQAGYDAICEGPYHRIQIKGRSMSDPRRGRLAKIDLKKDWDSVMLVLLDERYEPQSKLPGQRSSRRSRSQVRWPAISAANSV